MKYRNDEKKVEEQIDEVEVIVPEKEEAKVERAKLKKINIKVTNTHVNVRVNPSGSSPAIRVLTKGEEVECGEDCNGWTKVEDGYIPTHCVN